MSNKKFFIKVIIFIGAFLVLMYRLPVVIQVYGTEKDDVDRRACLFYTLPSDSVDVLFAGSSHVYCSYIPQLMYDEYGICSAILSTSSQSMQSTYWMLEEALKKQKPKVVVIDIASLAAQSDDVLINFRLHYTSGISAMPDYSINKYKAYKDISSISYGWAPNMTYKDAYMFMEYKNDFNRKNSDVVELVNLFINPATEFKTFGFYPTDSVYPLDTISYKSSDESENYIDFKSTDEYIYFEKIEKLLKENNIQLLLTFAPFYSEGDDCNLYEQIFSYIDEKDIPLVNFFDIADDVQLDLKTDFRDKDHLNARGAMKATYYMAYYLVENYNISDKRGTKKAELWDKMDYDYQSVFGKISERVDEK